MVDAPRTTLKHSLRVALEDCARFPHYLWKPKSMEKLAALGLVERVASPWSQPAYRITEAGKETLANV